MPHILLIRKNSYHDSVVLMRVSRELERLAGVSYGVATLGTPHNLSLLLKHGFDKAQLESAGPNDLIIAATGEGLLPEAVNRHVDQLLAPKTGSKSKALLPATLAHALKAQPDINLVVISVPGAYAAREARRALKLKRHVMLFSDNVSIEDEVELKNEAINSGLLLMGPDCGTAIINGKPLCFANVVRRGSIGVVGASGTGIQEVTACIHRLGGGISQAIGTGGRDLSANVGGLMTLFGIEALAQDPNTQVIVVISKPPHPSVAEKVSIALAKTGKPAVICFVGDTKPEGQLNNQIWSAGSLAGAAEQACRIAGLKVLSTEISEPEKLASKLVAQIPPKANKLCGLFCGGTTGHEALVLLGRAGLEIYSNLHKQGSLKVQGDKPSSGHLLLDLGDDFFTQGRPHPMIEPELRNESLLALIEPTTGILLFDLVLGFGSHPNPAQVLLLGLKKARQKLGREILCIASITGTDLDPQGYDQQKQILSESGVVVLSDNRKAALTAAAVLKQVRA